MKKFSQLFLVKSRKKIFIFLRGCCRICAPSWCMVSVNYATKSCFTDRIRRLIQNQHQFFWGASPSWLKILSIPSILPKNFDPVKSPAAAIWYNRRQTVKSSNQK
jgi:hypothetical protein